MSIPDRPEQRRSASEGAGTRAPAAPKRRLASDEAPQAIRVCDLYESWLPKGAGYSGFRVDFGIGNLSNKAHRHHLSLIDETGRNFKVSVSYWFLWGGIP